MCHCSDGWDRTSQMMAGTKLCLDPYYRSVSYPSHTHLTPISHPSHTHLTPISYPSHTHLIPTSHPSYTRNLTHTCSHTRMWDIFHSLCGKHTHIYGKYTHTYSKHTHIHASVTCCTHSRALLCICDLAGHFFFFFFSTAQ